MSDLKKTFFLLIMEVDSLKKDLEVAESIIEIATPSFNSDVRKTLGIETKIAKEDPPPKNQKIKKSNDSGAGDYTKIENQVDPRKNTKDKGLFKKIATKIHPDKMINIGDFEKEYKTSLFEKARSAADNEDYHEMYKIAKELDIEIPPPTLEVINSLRKTRDSVSRKMNSLKQSIIFVWYLEDCPKKKKAYISQFIKSNNFS